MQAPSKTSTLFHLWTIAYAYVRENQRKEKWAVLCRNVQCFLMFYYNQIIALCKYLIIKNIKSQSEIEMCQSEIEM